MISTPPESYPLHEMALKEIDVPPSYCSKPIFFSLVFIQYLSTWWMACDRHYIRIKSRHFLSYIVIEKSVASRVISPGDRVAHQR